MTMTFAFGHTGVITYKILLYPLTLQQSAHLCHVLAGMTLLLSFSARNRAEHGYY